MNKPYKGYIPEIWYEPDDKCFHAVAQGIKNIIHAESETIEGLQTAFAESVDCYLEICTEKGFTAQKPKSGKLAVRLAPEIHEMVSVAAVADAKSINQWISDILADAAEKRLQDNSIKIKTR